MSTSLKSLIEGAKNDADETIKAASLQAAPQADDAVVAHLFGGDDDEGDDDGDGEDAAAPEEQKVAGIKLAQNGVKIAEALEWSADILAQKLASEHAPAGSPAALEAPNNTTFTPATPPAIAAKIIPPVTDSDNVLKTNDNDLAQDGVEGATAGIGQKTSAHLQAELIAARDLMGIYSQIGSEALAKEAAVKVAGLEVEVSKLAQDPSSPQPALPGQGNAFRLPTNSDGGLPVSVGNVPATNQGMIDLTSGQARDKTTSEAGKFLSETPKRDNAVKAVVGRADGLKISSDQTAVTFPATYL